MKIQHAIKESIIKRLPSAVRRAFYDDHLLGFSGPENGKFQAAFGRSDTIVDELPAYVWVQDGNHKIIYGNRIFRDEVGCFQEEPCFRVVKGRDDVCPCCVASKMKDGNCCVECAECERSGKGKALQVFHTPLRNENGMFVILKLGIDIGPKRKAIATQQKNIAYLSSLLDALHIGIQGVDDKGITRYANITAARRLGYVTNELVGQPLSSWLPQAVGEEGENEQGKKGKELLSEAERKGLRWSSKLKYLLHRNGSKVPATIQAFPLGNGAGSVFAFRPIDSGCPFCLNSTQGVSTFGERVLPICAYCKKIRRPNGDWVSVEKYLIEHLELKCSHGLCPECLRNLYPRFYP